MHDILRERIWRKLQSLPPDQVYQALDYIEFLEAKYAREQSSRPDAIQKFAERLEDGMRMRSVAPKVISGTVGLLGTARRVIRSVSDAGRGILGETPATAGTAPPNGRPSAAVERSVPEPSASGRTDTTTSVEGKNGTTQ
ncbi:MAG TPA: DUF2281 domain-containing protein [Longimicrobiales bacterium]|nr:DUF2281 domain-containing protein [Longimicrobiales bacterium]